MTYSLALQTVHEQPANSDGSGAYTVLSVIQPFNLKLKKSKSVCIQKLAILWKDTVDTRLIAIVEKALIAGVLPPVKALYAAKGDLNIIYNSEFNGDDLPKFYEKWSRLASGAWYDEWAAIFFSEHEVAQNIGNSFFVDIREILDRHDFGIQPFTEEMFLFHDDWTPENIFGSDYVEEAEKRRAELANRAFDPNAYQDYPIF
jgi:hypothetical protein